MKLLAISVLSWATGLGAYLAALWGFWGERISSGDLRAVVFWSALVATVAIIIGYAPAMFVRRERLKRRGIVQWWPYPVVGMGLGLLPVLMIVGIWSSNIGRALMSPEAGLFYCMFAAFGATFGVGFFFGYGRHSA